MMKVLRKLSTCLRAFHASSNTPRLQNQPSLLLCLCILQSNPLQNWPALLKLRKARMVIHSPALATVPEMSEFRLFLKDFPPGGPKSPTSC